MAKPKLEVCEQIPLLGEHRQQQQHDQGEAPPGGPKAEIPWWRRKKVTVARQCEKVMVAQPCMEGEPKKKAKRKLDQPMLAAAAATGATLGIVYFF